MMIGIPVWDNRVSPVLDTALKLLVVESRDGREVSRKVLRFPALHPMHRAGFVVNAGIDVLICGAISRPLEQMLRSSGIEVHPYITGDVDAVVSAFSSGELGQERYILPGCGGNRGRRRMRRGHGRRAGFGYGGCTKEEE